jgi:hypothetical protein
VKFDYILITPKSGRYQIPYFGEVLPCLYWAKHFRVPWHVYGHKGIVSREFETFWPALKYTVKVTLENIWFFVLWLTERPVR